MSKRLSVPSELEHLIEKRDEDLDRRQTNRRRKTQSTNGATGSTAKPDRRQKTNRRRKPRRKADS
jgi:hypothetical protein